MPNLNEDIVSLLTPLPTSPIVPSVDVVTSSVLPIVLPAPISPVPEKMPESSSSHGETVIDNLLNEKLITKEQYDDIKQKSISKNTSIIDVIKSMNIVSESQIAEAKAKILKIPYLSLLETTFSPIAINFISRPVAERFQLIPFAYDEKNKILSVAMTDPTDIEAVQFIGHKTGLKIKVFAASSGEVIKSISQQYQHKLVGEVDDAIKETESMNQKIADAADASATIKEAPIAKIVSTILDYAVTSRSSDVHIEPQEDGMRVRYRIDGILYDRLSLPKSVQDAIISRIKILAELKIDEHRLPQDGRFNFKVGDKEVDLRISSLPTVNGEKIVMRLLRKSGGIPTLVDLGFNSAALKNLEASILRPHGIIIVCGPTGSGKTTTLYSILSRLNTSRVNIMSLEDPVEYQIPGVNQVQVNPVAGLTFASGLRSFLRQDPNVILVGEIRDTETTDLALQAALTGHLVFSTLHTSNAAGALPRLLDLGAEKFLLASTMNAIVGQRILRKICSSCKEEYIPSAQIIDEVKKDLGKLFPEDKDIKMYKGKGCGDCGQTGYYGRIGMYEVFIISSEVAQIMLQNPDSASMEQRAISEGMITMKQDGFLKVLKGITTIEEVLRVAQE